MAEDLPTNRAPREKVTGTDMFEPSAELACRTGLVMCGACFPRVLMRVVPVSYGCMRR